MQALLKPVSPTQSTLMTENDGAITIDHRPGTGYAAAQNVLRALGHRRVHIKIVDMESA